MEKLKISGEISKIDFKNLQKIDPTYAKNLSLALEKQDLQQKTVHMIQQKIVNNNLQPEDISALENVYPAAAEKLKAALKDQLKSKVSEVEKKLKTVKGAIDDGFNNTGFNSLWKQMKTLGGAVKPYDQKQLEKLQSKILANKGTSGSIFDEVFERLDLDYDIKNLTGSSEDLRQVLKHFFEVLIKFDIPLIFQKSAEGSLNGLVDVQDWFEMAAKIYNQAINKCGRTCKDSISYLVNITKANLKEFDIEFCKTRWAVGVKVADFSKMCLTLTKVNFYMDSYKFQVGNFSRTIKQNIVQPLNDIVTIWKGIRKEMKSLHKQQWKNNIRTINLLHNYKTVVLNLESAFSKALGKEKLDVLSESKIIELTEAYLSDKNSTVTLARYEALRISFISIVSAIKNLPAAIQRSKKTQFEVDTNQVNQMIFSFNAITNDITGSLNSLCKDKTPTNHVHYESMLTLIESTKVQYQKLLQKSKSVSDLFLYSKRISERGKLLLEKANEIKASLLPCKVKVENIKNKSDRINGKAFYKLRSFMRRIKRLPKKGVQDVAKDLKNIIGEFEGGISSPIGKLVSTMKEFIEQSPNFNIPLILTETPKTGAIIINSLELYFKSAKQCFIGFRNILQQCERGCTPEEVFGKSNLIEISEKLDQKLETISIKTRKFMDVIGFTPKGLPLLMTSIEELRASLQKIHVSGTGFTGNGIKNIIESFEVVESSAGDIRKSLSITFLQFTSTCDTNIKTLEKSLSRMEKNMDLIYKKSDKKLKNILEIRAKISQFKGELKNMAEGVKVRKNIMERRYDIVKESATIISEIGGQFHQLYSSRISDKLENFVDSNYTAEVTSIIENIRDSSRKILEQTNKMVDSVGIDLSKSNDPDLFNVNFSKFILDIINSETIQKIHVARQLKSVSNDLKRKTWIFIQRANLHINSFIGKNYFNETYERVKQKLAKYGKIYDQIEDTINEIKRKPIARIVKIKDAIDELITSLGEYKLAMILSADPNILPKKTEEMKVLFSNFGKAMFQIHQILKNSSHCDAINMFGYRYIRSLVVKLNNVGNVMFTNIETFADAIEDRIGEMQGFKKATGNIKGRFNKIFEGNKYDADTFKDISNALFDSMSDINDIRCGTENIAKIIFDRDIDFEVLSSTVNKMASQLGEVMNKSHQVAVRGEKIYTKAKDIGKQFAATRITISKIIQGPLQSRIKVVEELSASTKSLLKEFPRILELPEDALEEAGIDSEWLSKFGENIDGLTNTISSVISKTNRVMNAADMVVDEFQDIHGKYADTQKKINSLKAAFWDKKVQAWKELSANFDGLLDSAIDMTLKTSKVLNASLTKNNLKLFSDSLAGKERVTKYENLFRNISIIMDRFKQGPVPNIGKLTDKVEDFLDSLDGYDFGKMLLKSPTEIKKKFSEFKELAGSAGKILKNIASICLDCGVSDIVGKGFVKELAVKVEEKFEIISKSISNVLRRVETGTSGWESMVNTAKGISANFHGLTNGIKSKTEFRKLSDGLLKSAEDIAMFANGSFKIFEAVFNSNKDMEYLQEGFNNLVNKVSIVFNKSSVVLPNVEEVFESLQGVQTIFSNIKGNLKAVAEGPIESRTNILKKITKGIKSIRKSLSDVFEQSQEDLKVLMMDSKWFEGVAKDLLNVSDSIFKIMNKTDDVLNGAGIFVKGVKVKGSVVGIGEDLREIKTASLDRKFKILQNTFEKIDNVLDETNQAVGTIDQTLLEFTGEGDNITSHLGLITGFMSGVLGNLSTAVKKIVRIHSDVLATIDSIKSGPIQKIGKLADATKEFVKSIKNYDLAEILVQAPKFVKKKIGDFKQIITESGGILKSISVLATKDCIRCNLDSIFGVEFIDNISRDISESLINITGKLENTLAKVEDNAGHIVGLVSSVKSLKKQVSRLRGVDFSKDGFQTISNVLLNSSGYLEGIRDGSGMLAKTLFGKNHDLAKLMGNYKGFLNKISGHLETAGNFSKDVSDTFEQFKYLENKFDKVKLSFEDLTQGPLENRVKAVKSILTGAESVMRGLPEILKRSQISLSWLRSLGTQLEGINNGVSTILNKTNVIAGSVGKAIGNINKIQQTVDIISNDLKKLGRSGSIEGRVRIAKTIIGKVKILTTQVNVIVNNVNHTFSNMAGKISVKTNIFGNRTENILGKLSNGLGAVASRYEKFRELSETINDAFKGIEDDPWHFALNDLPKLFNQASKFTELLFDDVKEIAGKLGKEIDGLDILDKDIVGSAQPFFKFAQTTINTIGSGSMLVNDFKNLLTSKSFEDIITNLRELQTSGTNFIENIDNLGSKLFKNWDKMKDRFSDIINDISKSLGFNLKEMGMHLEKAFSVARDGLKIYKSITTLLTIKEFNVETVIQAADNLLQIAKTGVSVAKKFGLKIGGNFFQKADKYMNYVTLAFQLYNGIKDFVEWVNDVCHLTYEDVVTRRNITYKCFKQEVAIEKVLVPVAKCSIINKEVIKGYGEAKLCCSKKECVLMQQTECLKQNEKCSNSKLDLLSKLNISNSKLIPVYEVYLKSSRAASVKEKELKISKENLKTETYLLKRHEASLFQTKKLLQRAINATKNLERQFKSVESLYQAGKSRLKVKRIDFKFTTTDPRPRDVPFEISIADKNGQVSKIKTVFSFEKDVTSLKNVAQTILSTFFEHIPHMKHRRSIRSITDIQKKSDDLRHWTSLCIIYKEIFGTMLNTLKNLRAELDQATEIKQSGNANLQSASSQKIRLREIAYDASLVTINDTIRRWKKTVETILTENIGSICFGFRDCIETQIENLTSIYTPGLKGYDNAVSYLAILRSQLINFLEYANTRNKQTNIKTVSNILQIMKKIDINTYFCDELPRLVEKMPTREFAYLEEVFELNCTIDGPASMDYVWRKNDTILPDQTSWKLRIDDVSLDDRGYYSCEGKISAISVVSNKVLVQVYKKPSFIVQPNDQIFDFPGGQKFTWVCNGTAEPNCFCKWFFKPYRSRKPVLLGESSLLTLSHVSQRTVGYYWCEISNGITTITSRKAKLDVVRVTPRKVSARVSLKLSTNENEAACLLPPIEQSNDLLNAVKLTLSSKLGILETESLIDLLYYKDITEPRSANISLGVSLKQRRDIKTNSINLALEVSQERKNLREKLLHFLDKLNQGNGVSVYHNNCTVHVASLKLSIDWRADDLVCPQGMGTSKDNLKCGKEISALWV